jgi:hypothetical protein
MQQAERSAQSVSSMRLGISTVAKHYYSIELVSDVMLDEDDMADTEDMIRRVLDGRDVAVIKINTEYVDSEGI